MATSVEVSALILAGGRSSRMGRDKALIEVQGRCPKEDAPRSLLRHVYDAAAHCCSTVYVITKQPERYQALLPEDCRWIQEELSSSGEAFHGPLVAFAQALARINSEWVLLLACDLPFLDTKVLQDWIAQAANTVPPPLALVPVVDQRWEPLCALYHHSCTTSLNSFLARGGRSFQSWLDSEQVQALSVSDRTMLHNCNTPEDLAQILGSQSRG